MVALVGVLLLGMVTSFGPPSTAGGLCSALGEMPPFCDCTVAHAYGADLNCSTNVLGVSFDATFNFEPCDPKDPHIHVQFTGASFPLWGFDIGEGRTGSIGIPGLNYGIPIVAEAGASLTYEFGIQNGADADMSINIKLGLDACARLIPIAEECLGNYIPQLFPIVFLDETVNAGQVCGHGTDPSDENVCTTKANTCTNAPCKCPGLQRKVVHTYGTPVNTCWSDVVATILTALPRASWAPGKLYLDMHAFNAPNSSSGVLVDSLKAAVAAATGSTATTMVEVAVDEAFVPWGVLKHAGWNEPVNHLRSSTEFYRRLFQTIPGAPHDMPTLLQYHKHHSSSSS
eukprot:gene7757-32635_t